METIKIEALSKVYRKGMRQQRVQAITDLSLSTQAGEIFGFLGPNGAGKSTTIKILCDLIRPTRGRASILGKDVRQPAARTQMGYLPENPNYYGFLTGRELLGFHGALHGVAAAEIGERATRLLEMLDLAHAANRQLRTYSKGMVQRLGLAAALIHDPRVLILDEPMSGLDPLGRKLVRDMMLELRRQGKTIFFSTHILADVETVCDRIGIIVQGRLVFQGDLTSLGARSVQQYELVIEAADAKVLELPWPGRCEPRPQAGLYVIEVGADQIDEAVRLAVAHRVHLVAVESKGSPLEALFMNLTLGAEAASRE